WRPIDQDGDRDQTVAMMMAIGLVLSPLDECRRTTVSIEYHRRRERHVVNRAHRRTISAAPQDVSQSRRNSNVGCCSGVARGEPCQIHLRPHAASMSAIIAAFLSGLERRRWR